MEIVPLREPGHTGYLVRIGARELAIDPPLTATGEPTAVVETGTPDWRVCGGRLLEPGGDLGDFPEVDVVAAPGTTESDIAVLVGDALFVGGLDTDHVVPSDAVAARVVATRRALAARFPDATVYGSAGERTAAELAALPAPPVGPAPVNAAAVLLTNRGKGDFYWADARFGSPVSPVSREYVEGRAGSPWAPTVVDLRSGESPSPAGALRLPPAQLASEIGSIQSAREVVVLADDIHTAEVAAGFLRRLGFSASYVA